MQIGALGILGTAATAAHATRATETDRTAHENNVHDRAAQSATEANKAEGLDGTQEEPATSDRDGDGRQLWKRTPSAHGQPVPQATDQPSDEDELPHAKDHTGLTGTQFDSLG